jgi:hypothetical protein
MADSWIGYSKPSLKHFFKEPAAENNFLEEKT